MPKKVLAGWMWLLGLLASVPASGADHLLSIGGGSHPFNSQVSLEKNILFVQSYLHSAHLDGIPHEILFGGGLTNERDIQFNDPDAKLPPVNDLLARVFNKEQSVAASYRPHEIPNLWGSATRASLNRWFDTVGCNLKVGDRLFIYYTGHGRRGSGQGTTFVLWNEPDMPVREFSKLLDKVPASVPVVLVMVQCFSGGFADLIYTDADPSKGLSPRHRCGFFATLPDRTAAGCTPDIDEEDYKEYSTYFWAALGGRTRTGKTVDSADFDGDGKISFAEAHAWSLIHSDTVDISIKSSDVLLRKYADTKGKAPVGLPMVSSTDDFEKLLAMAGPVDQAVLKGLTAALKLDGPRPVMSAIRLAGDLARQQQAISNRQKKLEAVHRVTCENIERQVRHRWPELSNLFNPSATKVISEQGESIVRFIEASPQYADFTNQEKQIDAAEKQGMALERSWVKTQRLIRTAESVAMAANLPALTSGDIVKRYHELVDAEAVAFEASREGK